MGRFFSWVFRKPFVASSQKNKIQKLINASIVSGDGFVQFSFDGHHFYNEDGIWRVFREVGCDDYKLVATHRDPVVGVLSIMKELV